MNPNQITAVAFGGNNTEGPTDVATACNAHGGPHGRLDFESETFIAFDCKASGRNGFGEGAVAPTLRAMAHKGSHSNAGGQIAVAHALTAEGFDASEDGTGRGPPLAVEQLRVRRLMPVECERLQGFPDGYTDVPYRRRNVTPDGPRYKALGNSKAANCVRWLGMRIEEVDAMGKDRNHSLGHRS